MSDWEGFEEFARKWFKFNEIEKTRRARDASEESKRTLFDRTRIERFETIRARYREAEPPIVENVFLEDEMKRLVEVWLSTHHWICVKGHEGVSPDLFITNGLRIKGIEVAGQRIERHGFDVSKSSLKNWDILFVIVVEMEKEKFVPLILTNSEMEKKCKGKHLSRNRYGLSVPRNLEKWEEYKSTWDKLEK